MLQPRTTPSDPLTPMPAWLAAGAALALATALIVVMAPGAVARRLTVTSLPEGADLAYARDMFRYLAGTVALATGALLAWWKLAPRFRMLDLGRWTLAAAVALYVAAALSMWWYVDDDAGISFTFARNLADGHGLIFNPGEAPIEGYSNPLWVALLAAARLMHLDIIVTAKVLGLVFGVLSLLVMWSAVRELHPVAWLALPLAGLNAAAVVWTSSGLENALHALLLTATVVLLPAAERRAQARWLLMLVLAALAVSRPEGAMFAAAAAAYLAVRAWRRGESGKSAIALLVFPMLAFAGLLVFRKVYFGDLLPNTYYAKASSSNPLRLLNPSSGGWAYVADGVSACGWTLGLLPILILLAVPGSTRRTPIDDQGSSARDGGKGGAGLVPAAVLIVAAQLFFVVSVGGDWMKEFRFLAPIVPAVSLLIGIGLARIVELLRQAGVAAWRSALACGLLVALMLYPQAQRLIVFAHDPTTPLQTVAAIGDYFKELGARAGLEDPTLLHHDAGGTSYLAQIHLIDLAGLCDHTIARQWRDRVRMRAYIFQERRPDFIYSGPHFAERIGLEEFPEFEADYVQLPPAPRPELDGYIRRVRRDLYARIFGAAPPPAGEHLTSADAGR